MSANPCNTGRLYSVLGLLSMLMLCTSGIQAKSWTKQLASGITLTQIVESSGRPLLVNVLIVDPKSPGVRVQAVLAQDRVFGSDGTKGRETVGSIARRLNAVAAVNADFFPWTGDALSLHISGGELVSEPYPGRMVFGITSDRRFLFDTLGFDARVTLPDGRYFAIRGINRPRGKNEIVAYTSRFSPSTCTSGAGSEAVIKCDNLPIRPGIHVTGTVREVRPGGWDTPIPEGSLVLSGTSIGAKYIDANLKPGTPVTLRFDLRPSGTEGWDGVVEAVGGGPCLMKDGRVCIDAEEEGFKPDITSGSHPRTAIGVTSDGRLVLVTVDGRQSLSRGMTLAQLAELMRSLGCASAINLDGGGSTTMATSIGTLNSPSEGIQRPVANGLAVFGVSDPGLQVEGLAIEAGRDPAAGVRKLASRDAVLSLARSAAPPDTILTPSDPQPPTSSAPVVVRSGGTCRFSLADTSEGRPLDPSLAEQAIWSTTGGIGFVDQSGLFYGMKARSGSVVALLGSATASIPVEVLPGPPASLSGKFEADPTGAPNRSVLRMSLMDLNGNPVKGERITVKVTGGVPDQAEALTGEDGKACIGVTWDSRPGSASRAEAVCSSLAPVIVRPPK